MTAPRLTWRALLDLASELGCAGVEFRNDLNTPLFSDDAPETVRDDVARKNLRIVGLSQVYPFNSWSDEVRHEVANLIDFAKACGAETISLIPRNDGTGTSDGERQANLRLALKEIRSMLAEAKMIALVEPLGFARSSLRYKSEAIETIKAIGGENEFRIVHDTFHHFLAEEPGFFPKWTGIVHVSGVVEQSLGSGQMEDKHRVLVDAEDRLGNISQLRALQEGGYDGIISFEAFSPRIHALDDPKEALFASMEFIASRLEIERRPEMR